MSATVTDMRGFIEALDRHTPRGRHPYTDRVLHEYFSEMRAEFEHPAEVLRLMDLVRHRVVQELEFQAENMEDPLIGDYREAYHYRRQAARFNRMMGGSAATIAAHLPKIAHIAGEIS